mmetsp:Transcript_33144/g.84682  ORF Transcript_33144/g.84682 Transcript_33144/m.84682 type:complete len:236 (-) Transcript_33144:399-1106(-)
MFPPHLRTRSRRSSMSPPISPRSLGAAVDPQKLDIPHLGGHKIRRRLFREQRALPQDGRRLPLHVGAAAWREGDVVGEAFGPKWLEPLRGVQVHAVQLRHPVHVDAVNVTAGPKKRAHAVDVDDANVTLVLDGVGVIVTGAQRLGDRGGVVVKLARGRVGGPLLGIHVAEVAMLYLRDHVIQNSQQDHRLGGAVWERPPNALLQARSQPGRALPHLLRPPGDLGVGLRHRGEPDY